MSNLSDSDHSDTENDSNVGALDLNNYSIPDIVDIMFKKLPNPDEIDGFIWDDDDYVYWTDFEVSEIDQRFFKDIQNAVYDKFLETYKPYELGPLVIIASDGGVGILNNDNIDEIATLTYPMSALEPLYEYDPVSKKLIIVPAYKKEKNIETLADDILVSIYSTINDENELWDNGNFVYWTEFNIFEYLQFESLLESLQTLDKIINDHIDMSYGFGNHASIIINSNGTVGLLYVA